MALFGSTTRYLIDQTIEYAFGSKAGLTVVPLPSTASLVLVAIVGSLTRRFLRRHERWPTSQI